VALPAWLRLDGADTCIEEERFGRFVISADGALVVSPAPDSPPLWVELALATTVGAVHAMRTGLVALHGATVRAPGRSDATLLVAQSGGGKSTTTTAFSQLGWQVVADDVSVVDSGGGVRPLGPFPVMRLFDESCVLLGIDPIGLPEGPAPRVKRLIAGPPHAAPACSIARVVELVAASPGSPGSVARLRGHEVVAAVVGSLYWPVLLDTLDARAVSVRLAMALASQCPTWRVTVDRSMQSPADVARLISSLSP
jgi:hypothetical protein